MPLRQFIASSGPDYSNFNLANKLNSCNEDDEHLIETVYFCETFSAD